MTYRELLQKEHPENVDELYIGGCEGCPCDYGYEADKEKCLRLSSCDACWDREIPGSGEIEGQQEETK